MQDNDSIECVFDIGVDPSTVDEMNKAILNHLPEWAIGKAGGLYLIGAQLPTRDGRRMGNAHIIDVGESPYHRRWRCIRYSPMPGPNSP